MDKDATAAAALQRMKDILANAAPYGMIKDAASLIQTVETVDTALVKEYRDKVLPVIDEQIDKVQMELDSVKAPSDLRNQCLYSLQQLKLQVQKQASIAHIDNARQAAITASDDAFNKIEAASKPKVVPDTGDNKKPSIGEEKPPVYVKPRRIVKAAGLAPKNYLETQDDIDDFLNRLRKALEAGISAGQRIEIR